MAVAFDHTLLTLCSLVNDFLFRNIWTHPSKLLLIWAWCRSRTETLSTYAAPERRSCLYLIVIWIIHAIIILIIIIIINIHDNPDIILVESPDKLTPLWAQALALVWPSRNPKMRAAFWFSLLFDLQNVHEYLNGHCHCNCLDIPNNHYFITCLVSSVRHPRTLKCSSWRTRPTWNWGFFYLMLWSLVAQYFKIYIWDFGFNLSVVLIR